jgi:hypothetical protein
LGAKSVDELDMMQVEDLEESVETLCEDQLRAWLHAKKKGKKFGCTSVVLQLPSHNLALEMGTLSGYCGHFVDDTEASGPKEGVDINYAKASDTDKGVAGHDHVIDISSSDEDDV